MNLTKADLDKVRDIDGFPEGKDEDIIALSQAPDYTACPNPFLGKFLEENGKPYDEAADNYHREPFAVDVSEGKSDAVYNIHTYHTKVPPKAIARYIMHYTDPGDVVLDSFCGTGMTGVAGGIVADQDTAFANGFQTYGKGEKFGARHLILNDLSPVATYIASVYNLKSFCAEEVEKEGKKILEEFDQAFGDMYEIAHISGGLERPETAAAVTKGRINYIVWSDVVICPSCGKELVFSDIGMNKETGIRSKGALKCPYCGTLERPSAYERAIETAVDPVLDVPVTRVKECPVLIHYSVGKKKYERRPTETEAKKLLEKIGSDKYEKVPVVKLPEGVNTAQPRKSHYVEYVHQMYSERGLFVFSWLWNRIAEVEDAATRNVLRFSLESVCVGFSKMNRYFASSFSQVNRYLKGTLYIAPIRSEVSPEYAWSGKLGRIAKLITNPSCCITTGSATQLNIPDNSVDYVFIDPPFGANIMYSELNLMWEAWLGVRTNTAKEAIVNETQKKGREEYAALMTASIAELARVLKPDRWITIEFHNSSNRIWNILQNAIQDAGLVIADIRVLDKMQQTMKQFSTKGSVDKDLVISAYKPNEAFTKQFMDQTGDPEMAWAFARQHLRKTSIAPDANGDGKIDVVSERKERLLFDRMVAWHIMNGKPVPVDSITFYKGLKERFIERDGMFFLPDQVNEYDEKRARMELDNQQMSFVISDEKNAIGWLNYILSREAKTYQELQPLYLQELHQSNQEKMPELLDMLKQNFIQDDKGAWYVPDLNNAADLAKIRRRALLKEFYDVCVPGKGKLRNVRTEAVRAGFDECWKNRDYQMIVNVGNKLPEAILFEDSALYMYFSNAGERLK